MGRFAWYKQLFTVFYPVQILALAGIIHTVALGAFDARIIAYMVIGWVLMCGLGSAITLHRYVSHRAIKVHPFLHKPMLLLGAMCAQGSPMWWATVHRGLHHPNSDTDEDAHSPIHGNWHAYHGWLFTVDPTKVNLLKIKDLLKDKFGLLLYHWYTEVVWASYLLICMISPTFLLWGIIIPAAWSYHQESIVNILCHNRKFGYRNYETDDNSMNSKLLSLFTWGQSLHNNHHHRPGTFDFGTAISGKKSEFDPCRLLLPFIRAR